MRIIILFCLMLLLVQPVVAQAPIAVFDIHPETGQFSVSAIEGDLLPGYISLTVDGTFIGDYFVPPVAQTLYTVLDIVPIPRCSWEVSGDYSYSWFNPTPQCFDPVTQPIESTVREIDSILTQFVEPFRKRQ